MLIEHAAKIIPFSPPTTNTIQSLGYTFIWRGKSERLAVSEMYNTYLEGGLNLTHLTSLTHEANAPHYTSVPCLINTWKRKKQLLTMHFTILSVLE